MKRNLCALLACLAALALLPAGCGTDRAAAQAEQTEQTAQHAAPKDADTQEEPSVGAADENVGGEEENMPMKMNVQVGGSTFTATLEDNAAAEALAERMERSPVTIQMSDYAGFEKVGALETGLPAEDSRLTTQAGDIVLYQGDQIVVFYGSNTWSYTLLGRIDDLTGWEDALGSGDVTVTFSLEA